jgi:hypothetical protein
VLNAGMLALGVEKGTNATWEGRRARAHARRAAQGQAALPRRAALGRRLLYIYAAWREGGQVYYYRVDDLIANLKTGRSMVRHVWSSSAAPFIEPAPGKDEVFAADLEQNLVNLTFFLRGPHARHGGRFPDCEGPVDLGRQPVAAPRARGARALDLRARSAGGAAGRVGRRSARGRSAGGAGRGTGGG